MHPLCGIAGVFFLNQQLADHTIATVACGHAASFIRFLCTRHLSSIVVAKWAEKHAQQLVGQRVLDLSAGCGLVALAAARLGAARVVATDLGPNLPLLRKNAEANGEEQHGAATLLVLLVSCCPGWCSTPLPTLSCRLPCSRGVGAHVG